jgi:serine/threonine protein kinase
MIAGTLPYLAPEILSGQPASERSDAWSLCVLLHEMAAGTMPFEGRTGYELTSAILREPPRPLERVPPPRSAPWFSAVWPGAPPARLAGP